jgi:hypothetical protein
MIQPKKPDIDAIFRDGVEIDRAMARAAREARIEHKKLGLPLVIWRDGKTVEVPPDQIVIDDEPEERAPRGR